MPTQLGQAGSPQRPGSADVELHRAHPEGEAGLTQAKTEVVQTMRQVVQQQCSQHGGRYPM